MVKFVILKWYKLLYYKEILSIYWMTLVASINHMILNNFKSIWREKLRFCQFVRNVVININAWR